MKLKKVIPIIIFIVFYSFVSFSQNYEDIKIKKAEEKEKMFAELNGKKFEPKNSKDATGITLGGDAINNSLKIQIYGDNIQVYRYTGEWNHQWFTPSDITDPWKCCKLQIDGNGYSNDASSTTVYVEGSEDVDANDSYYEGFGDDDPYNTVYVNKIDNNNAEIIMTRTGVVEVKETINYPAESDYINYQSEKSGKLFSL